MILHKAKKRIPIYEIPLTIAFTDDIDKEMKSLGFNEGYAMSDGVVFHVKNEIFSYFNPNVPLSVIVHESVHITNRAFWIVGHELDLENDEPQAYLTDYVFDLIMVEYDKLKNKTKQSADI